MSTCQCTQCRTNEYPPAVLFAPMFKSQPFWLSPEVRSALVKALQHMPSRTQRRGKPNMHRHHWCATYLKNEYGWEFTPWTVHTMLSRHGLTKKRGYL